VMDLAEAMAIGERLGDKVVVMAASTGASLATWGMMQPAYRDLVAAAVLISPNYGIRAFGASLLTIPFARQLAHLLMGRTRSFEPDNELQRLYWTTTYPVDALLPMAETVRLAINAPVEKTAIPALFLISPEDMVVDPDKTRAIARRWGAACALMEVGGVEDPARHVLGGDAMSPGTTATVARLATRWLGEVVPEAERHILEKAFLTPTQSADI
jgi:alpha-beta hydrolase superfamily lysophospholipase